MGIRKKIVMLFGLILLLNLVSALEVGVGDDDIGINLVTTTPINYSTYNVTSALWWGSYLWTNYNMPVIKSFGYNQTTIGQPTWLYNIGTQVYFNESKLATIYYDATVYQAVAGTGFQGTLVDTQHPNGIYDGKTFNFTEVAGSPGLDLRINFTGVENFNVGVIRYKTSSLAGDYPIIQLWNYDDLKWEDYPQLATSSSFATITQPVFDSSDHVNAEGVVAMRLYKASNGNTNNHYYIDWVSVSKGYGTPAGEEVDPLSFHRDGSTQMMGNTNWGGYNLSNIKNLTGGSVHIIEPSTIRNITNNLNLYTTTSGPPSEVFKLLAGEINIRKEGSGGEGTFVGGSGDVIADDEICASNWAETGQEKTCLASIGGGDGGWCVGQADGDNLCVSEGTGALSFDQGVSTTNSPSFVSGYFFGGLNTYGLGTHSGRSFIDLNTNLKQSSHQNLTIHNISASGKICDSVGCIGDGGYNYTGAYGDYDIGGLNVTGNVNFTSATSIALNTPTTTFTSTGIATLAIDSQNDCKITLKGGTWAAGYDHSNGNFVISRSATLGTNNRLTIGYTSGEVIVAKNLTASSSVFMPGLFKIDGTTACSNGDALKWATGGRIYCG